MNSRVVGRRRNQLEDLAASWTPCVLVVEPEHGRRRTRIIEGYLRPNKYFSGVVFSSQELDERGVNPRFEMAIHPEDVTKITGRSVILESLKMEGAVVVRVKADARRLKSVWERAMETALALVEADPDEYVDGDLDCSDTVRYLWTLMGEPGRVDTKTVGGKTVYFWTRIVSLYAPTKTRKGK